MKKIILSIFLSAFLLSCSNSAKEFFFECELENPEVRGSFAKISYRPSINSASLISDFMNDETPALGTIFPVESVSTTGSELIIFFKAYPQQNGYSDFRINRRNLELSGTRKGSCKIVELDKELLF